jgi:hypothetical protein
VDLWWKSTECKIFQANMCITLSLLDNWDLMCDTRHIHFYRACCRKCICFSWTAGVYSNFLTAVFIFFIYSSAERKNDQICSPGEYQRVFERLKNLPSGVDRLVIQTGADTHFFFHFSDNLYSIFFWQSRYPYCLSTHGVPRGCAGV